MSLSPSQATAYLAELYRATDGDPSAQVSMYDIGAAIGLDKAVSGKLAEELIASGDVEIRTLSGGIGITAQGIDSAAAETGAPQSTQRQLGSARVLDENDHTTVQSALAAVKRAMGNTAAPYDHLEALVIDIKTIEIQLLAPQPKTAVIREVFRSLHGTLSAMNLTAEATEIERMIAN
jgi:hypothetical protein